MGCPSNDLMHDPLRRKESFSSKIFNGAKLMARHSRTDLEATPIPGEAHVSIWLNVIVTNSETKCQAITRS